MKGVKDEGIVTQLAVVATMMPKVKEYIDQQADRIAELEKRKWSEQDIKILMYITLTEHYGIYYFGKQDVMTVGLPTLMFLSTFHIRIRSDPFNQTFPDVPG